jgi:hypothetical protein
MQPIILLLFAHFLGDFLFQSNDMALKKAKSIKWLMIHVGAYTMALGLVALLLFPWHNWWLFVLLNGALHAFVDFFTSKIIARASQWQDKKWFYTGIGFDQFLHGACLVWTYDLFR